MEGKPDGLRVMVMTVQRAHDWRAEALTDPGQLVITG